MYQVLTIFNLQRRQSLAVMVAIKAMTQHAYLISVLAAVHACLVNFTFSRRSVEGPLVTSSKYVRRFLLIPVFFSANCTAHLARCGVMFQ